MYTSHAPSLPPHPPRPRPALNRVTVYEPLPPLVLALARHNGTVEDHKVEVTIIKQRVHIEVRVVRVNRL